MTFLKSVETFFIKRFHSAMATLEPQNVIAETVWTENIVLVSRRLVIVQVCQDLGKHEKKFGASPSI